nr:hypothetical protein [Pandoravirus belohorizontensis]
MVLGRVARALDAAACRVAVWVAYNILDEPREYGMENSAILRALAALPRPLRARYPNTHTGPSTPSTWRDKRSPMPPSRRLYFFVDASETDDARLVLRGRTVAGNK